MPTYDYLCPNGHRFEVVHGVSADGPDTCPICGASPVRKAFTAPSIVFKGSGWAKKDRSATSKPASSSSAVGEGSSETKSTSGSSADGVAAATETTKPATDATKSPGTTAAAD